MRFFPEGRVLRVLCILAIAIAACALRAFAGAAPIGNSTIRHFDPSLTGAGISVAQVEASSPGWQANPSALNPLGCQMSWVCGSGCSTNFPNLLGDESS